MKHRNSMANGKKDAPITQMHMPNFTKPLGYDRTITLTAILEDITSQPKEETPWMSTQL
jgi:hypothetical protein